jgi:hypothetical protein
MALSENPTARPFLGNLLYPLNREEPTLATTIRFALVVSAGLLCVPVAGGQRAPLNSTGYGERLDEGIGVPRLSGL